ncbi:MAG: acyl carrier protein [Desulfobacterales bacterium]
MKTAVLEIIGRIAPEAGIKNLDPGKRLRDQFDFDSVDFMDFAAALQDRLDVKIPEADYPELATLNSCIAYLRSKMNA